MSETKPRMLLDAKAAGERLGYTPQHVRRLWQLKMLPFVELPTIGTRRKVRRVDRDVLERWIAARSTGAERAR